MLSKYIAILIGWSFLIGGSLVWNLHQLEHNKLNTAASAARASLTKDMFFREWASSHGGVYVRPTAHTPPNPYLKVPDRDVVTTTGMKLTLMNPAYVIREVQEDANTNPGIQSHLTSLKLFNPKNAPDEWETRALKSFDQGNKESLEVGDIKGKPYLRLMLPLPVTQGCLKCHDKQGYKVGDVRGGISASVLLDPYTEVQLVRRDQLALSHGGIWFVGILGLLAIYLREKTHLAERNISDAHIYDLAFYDTLTHLPNRRLMLDRLKQTLLSSNRKKRYAAILFINLDDFKSLNDTKGHDVGDLLLIEITRRLQAAVHEDDTVARLGADEFVVVLNTLDVEIDLAAAQARMVAEKILAAINLPHRLPGHDYHCSASIGISLFRDNEITVDELLQHADTAMHQAKQTGRNTICFFDPATQQALEARVQMEAWMRAALNDQYRLYYQIQVDGEGAATGAEALIRWLHPEKGIIYPGDFIPLAESTGLILTIGKWVLETACAQLKAWEQGQNTRHLVLAVNVSARQFHRPDFVQQVIAVLEQTGADPSKLKLELTESLLVDDIADIISKMAELKARGVKFSLDDFGTGFSSLSYLKRLPLNQLKIDQSFVRDALTDPNDAAIIRTVIALGQSLGLDVIAEGVETEEHRNFLAIHGCTHYQGYLFSRPVPLEEFEALLKQA